MKDGEAGRNGLAVVCPVGRAKEQETENVVP